VNVPRLEMLICGTELLLGIGILDELGNTLEEELARELEIGIADELLGTIEELLGAIELEL